MAAARSLAQTMAAQNIHLVYGGGTVGLMGEVARTLVSLSGPESVHGIIPAPLVKHERAPEHEAASAYLLLAKMLPLLLIPRGRTNTTQLAYQNIKPTARRR